MYHGVGEVGIDPWGLFVSPDNFAQHLQVLRSLAEPMRLGELRSACVSGTLPAKAAVVTIDDGYANILHAARPLLEEHEVPATLFAVSEPLHDATEYWWDDLAGIVLRPGPLPGILRLGSIGSAPAIGIGQAGAYSDAQHRADFAYRDEEAVPSPRMELYRTLWQLLVPLDHDERQTALAELREWAASPDGPRPSHRSMSIDELVELDGDVVEVGGHTLTHPLLPNASPARQAAEIEGNKQHLEAVLGREVTSFSYPFGANNADSVNAARTAGYQLAVSCRPQTVSVDADPFLIGRFDVKNWGGEEFERRLTRWFRYQ